MGTLQKVSLILGNYHITPLYDPLESPRHEWGRRAGGLLAWGVSIFLGFRGFCGVAIDHSVEKLAGFMHPLSLRELLPGCYGALRGEAC